MKKMSVRCAGCGKMLEVTAGKGHTGVVKCECGATTAVKGDASPILDQLNELMGKVPEVLREFKNSRRKGFETGIDEALHQVSRELAGEILRTNAELREALKNHVQAALEAGLMGEPDDGPEF